MLQENYKRPQKYIIIKKHFIAIVFCVDFCSPLIVIDMSLSKMRNLTSLTQWLTFSYNGFYCNVSIGFHADKFADQSNCIKI